MYNRGHVCTGSAAGYQGMANTTTRFCAVSWILIFSHLENLIGGSVPIRLHGKSAQDYYARACGSCP